MCTITHKIFKVHLSGKPKILLKFHNLQFQNVQINYSNGKFNIEWKNLDYEYSKDWEKVV